MRTWLIEFQEVPLKEKGFPDDVIESKEEMLSFINAWIADDPGRAGWLKATDAVLMEARTV